MRGREAKEIGQKEKGHAMRQKEKKGHTASRCAVNDASVRRWTTIARPCGSSPNLRRPTTTFQTLLNGSAALLGCPHTLRWPLPDWRIPCRNSTVSGSPEGQISSPTREFCTDSQQVIIFFGGRGDNS